MDDQALLEGIVVFSDEDGPGEDQQELVTNSVTHSVCVFTVCDVPLFLSLRWSVSRTVLMERLLMTLPGVT